MKLAQLVKQDIPILDYARSRGLTPKRVGPNEYTLAEHDSMRINTVNNLCYRHATGEGGSIIDFVMILERIDGRLCDERRALGLLRAYLHHCDPGSAGPPAAKEKKEVLSEPKPFRLPKATPGPCRRVYAYLCHTRGIDREIVTDFIRRRWLYEDICHNCVFVGYDDLNRPAYAMKRGTLTDKPFKGEVEGSRKIGLFVDYGSRKLFVAESAIDVMSLMTMLKLHSRDYRAYSYLSLGCLSDTALQYRLSCRPKVDTLLWALDNDFAAVYDNGRPAPNHGQVKAKEYHAKYSALGYRSVIITPHCKDPNEDLMQMRGILRGV